MQSEVTNTVGLIMAILGAGLLLIGTYLHPMSADPNVPAAAFTEYAADPHWVASHLLQLFGAILLIAALVLFSRRLENGSAVAWTTIIRAGAGASLAMVAALQAVDGIALKVMVDSWAAAAEPEKLALFQAAFAVRQIEVGLASISSLLFGLTVLVYGIALLIDQRFPRWIGALAMLVPFTVFLYFFFENVNRLLPANL